VRVQRGLGEGAPGGGRVAVGRAQGGVAARPVQQLEVAEEAGGGEHRSDFFFREKTRLKVRSCSGGWRRRWRRRWKRVGGALTRAMSVGGRRPAVARVGEEGGQAGVVRVRAGEEDLPVVSRRQKAGLGGETGQRIGAEQRRRRPVGLLGQILHADGSTCGTTGVRRSTAL